MQDKTGRILKAPLIKMFQMSLIMESSDHIESCSKASSMQ